VSVAEGPVTTGGGNVIDLMEALRASIDAKSSKVTDLKQRKGP
jgi:non-homologous end joining protein Ku